jgi:glycosyltransferase involved in cell wall biosynthesis
MDIAILAPSPVPLMIGGAENLWWGLLDYLNRRTPHHADLIKLPTPEKSFWEIIDSYRRWSELDVSGYDVVITGKYPAWMVAHRVQVCYLLHPLRGVYDTYPAGWPERCEIEHPEIQRLVELLDVTEPDRALLAECFARLDALRRRSDVPAEVFALPGPLIRQVVHFLDRIGRSSDAVARLVAQSATVAARPGYFRDAEPVPVAHPPTGLRGLHRGRGHYVFTVSRLDGPKRIDLLIRAMQHTDRHVTLRIAGTGPEEEALRKLAADNPRIRFDGFLNDAELVEAYAGALAVAFVPSSEDYGFITLEAMLSAKPVITTTDAGGPTELIDDGVHGLVTEPDPVAVGAAMNILTSKPRLARRMGRAGEARAARITWDAVASALLEGLAIP